jgi:hypothetical protein
MKAADVLANGALALAMNTLGRLHYDRLLVASQNPRAAQAGALRRILAANAETEQGRALRLGLITDADAFRRSVPINDYEALRPLVTRQIETGAHVIAPQTPIMYARSSGTTGAAKYIPVTADSLAQMRAAQRALAYVQHRALRAFSGKVLGIGGSAGEEMLVNGVAAGATTGLIYETMPRAMRAKYVVPPDVFAIEDYEERYRTIARLAALEPDISAIATANPSTILRLLDVLRADLDKIAEIADDRRGSELARLKAQNGPLTLAQLWPGLRSVVTWLGGGCAIAAEKIKCQLPQGARMVDAGYVASEVRGSIIVDVENNLALPMLEDVFFEFADVECWDAGERDTFLLHELNDGGEYYVLVSTIAGLMRYHMNDVVRVSGRVGATPSLHFVRKGRGVTNITGEKLSEDQLQNAMAGLSPAPHFFIALADAAAARYRIYALLDDAPQLAAATIDSRLRQLNLEYDAKRASGRLLAPEVICISADAANAYHRHCVEQKKQREAQVKVLSLQTIEEFDFDFGPYVVSNASQAALR